MSQPDREQFGAAAYVRAHLRWARAWGLLLVKYLAGSLALLFIMFSIFFVAMGAMDLTSSENAYGWLFGGWFVVYLGLVVLFGKFLKHQLRHERNG